jgi:hypothetical protein
VSALVLHVLGPGSVPPQGARALVRELLRPGAARVKVSAVLFDDVSSTTSALQFLNEGGVLVGELEYALIDDEGTTHSGQVGTLAAGADVTVPLNVQIDDVNVRCVWLCVDVKGRWHAWRYDGSHKRLGKHGRPSVRECLRALDV